MKTYNLHMLFGYCVAILLLFACNPHHKASDLLRQAQNIVDTQPDIALQLIDSIFYPKRSLNKREYMSFLVTRVQARHRNLLPINEDTLIFIARDYFSKHNRDLRQTALAYFYSGCVYREQENAESAMKQYKHAAEYAIQTDDADLKGLIHFTIGDLLARGGLYLQALEEYKNAGKFFANSFEKSLQKQARCFVAIGQMYLFSDKQNNALTAFYEGFELAKRSENAELKSLLAHNLSTIYRELQEYENTETYLRLSFALRDDETEQSRYYLNFAKLFTLTHQPDSVLVYMEKVRQTIDLSDDLYFQASAYNLLAVNARENGNYCCMQKERKHYQ